MVDLKALYAEYGELVINAKIMTARIQEVESRIGEVLRAQSKQPIQQPVQSEDQKKIR